MMSGSSEPFTPLSLARRAAFVGGYGFPPTTGRHSILLRPAGRVESFKAERRFRIRAAKPNVNYKHGFVSEAAEKLGISHTALIFIKNVVPIWGHARHLFGAGLV